MQGGGLIFLCRRCAAARGPFLFDSPGATRPPWAACGGLSAKSAALRRFTGPCAYFWPAPKVGKNAPEPMVLDSFLGAACSAANLGGGVKGRAAGFLVRRSLRIGSPPSAALVLVELRLPAFQRGTAVQRARGLTVHSSDSHPHRQTFVPSAARQPAPSIGPCAEAGSGIGPRHGR